MWRIGVLALAVLLELTSADIKTGVNDELAQRFRRSPSYYDCGPPQGPPRFWPQPQPPPFWRHHHHPPPWELQQYQNQYSNLERNANGETGDGGTVNEEGIKEASKPPCTACGDKGSNAVSNAKSESGQAIAIAISKANPN